MAVTPRDLPPVRKTDLELQVQSRRPRHRWKKENENLEPIVNGSWSESGRVSAVFPEEPREPPNYRPVNRNEGSLVFLLGVIGRNWARAGTRVRVLVPGSIGIQDKRKNWIDNCDLGSRRGEKNRGCNLVYRSVLKCLWTRLGGNGQSVPFSFDNLPDYERRYRNNA